MTESSGPHILPVGGTVNPRRHIYISRDDVESELFTALLRAEYCNILAPRQIGKSSIMVRTAGRLKDHGVRVAVVDATVFGSYEAPRLWFRDVTQHIAAQLGIPVNIDSWWQEEEIATPSHAFVQFFRLLVFMHDVTPVVIFVDEIDSTLKLAYSDDFFTAIRAMHNQRATECVFEKLTFCLVGVAIPNELIKDRRTTPYNIGRTISLRDFDAGRDDLSSLERALAQRCVAPRNVLESILEWTAGQPYLTLLLCRAVIESTDAGVTVNAIVEKRFCTVNAVRSDVHFQQILAFLDGRLPDRVKALQLYRRILAGRGVRDDDAATHRALKLSGLVKRTGDGMLVSRNRIYALVFNRNWLSENKVFRQARQRAGVVGVITLALLLGALLGGYYWRSAHRLQLWAHLTETADYAGLIGLVDRFPTAAQEERWSRIVQLVKEGLGSKARRGNVDERLRCLGEYQRMIPLFGLHPQSQEILRQDRDLLIGELLGECQRLCGVKCFSDADRYLIDLARRLHATAEEPDSSVEVYAQHAWVLAASAVFWADLATTRDPGHARWKEIEERLRQVPRADALTVGSEVWTRYLCLRIHQSRAQTVGYAILTGGAWRPLCALLAARPPAVVWKEYGIGDVISLAREEVADVDFATFERIRSDVNRIWPDLLAVCDLVYKSEEAIARAEWQHAEELIQNADTLRNSTCVEVLSLELAVAGRRLELSLQRSDCEPTTEEIADCLRIVARCGVDGRSVKRAAGPCLDWRRGLAAACRSRWLQQRGSLSRRSRRPIAHRSYNATLCLLTHFV